MIFKKVADEGRHCAMPVDGSEFISSHGGSANVVDPPLRNFMSAPEELDPADVADGSEAAQRAAEEALERILKDARRSRQDPA
jgi:hypothetical protein